MICIDCSNSNNKNECPDCSNYLKESHVNEVASQQATTRHALMLDISQIQTFDGWNCQHELDLIDNLLKIPNQTCIFDAGNIENEKLKIKQSNLPDNYIQHIEKWFSFFNNPSNGDTVDESELYRERVKLSALTAKDLTESGCDQSTGPFRPQVHSKLYRASSGYRYARGDFETEYDDKFEARYIADLDYGADGIENEIIDENQVICY